MESVSHPSTSVTTVASTQIRLSVVIPVLNEAENLHMLHQKLSEALCAVEGEVEVVYVDDGSTDSSYSILTEIFQAYSGVVVIRLRRNFGQSVAMAAGVDHSRGEIVMFMDADLQNDPSDIPKLLDKLEEGYDIVSGWRKNRHDNWLLRKVPSVVANRLISWVTGVNLKDYGCSLKAYRRNVIEHVRLYGEMHRFLPALAHQVGATIVEIPVNHHPRTAGQSKYGIGRTWRVLLDLGTVKFLGSFLGKPIYLFGGVGLVLVGLSGVSGVGMVVQKWVHGVSFINTPLLLLSAILFVMGIQSFLLGLVSELLVRTYHESQEKPPYFIGSVLRGQSVMSDCGTQDHSA